MMPHRASRYMLALVLLATPLAARAQAFGLNEIGSCAIARGFALKRVVLDRLASHRLPNVLLRIDGFDECRLLLFCREIVGADGIREFGGLCLQACARTLGRMP